MLSVDGKAQRGSGCRHAQQWAEDVVLEGHGELTVSLLNIYLQAVKQDGVKKKMQGRVLSLDSSLLYDCGILYHLCPVS